MNTKMLWYVALAYLVVVAGAEFYANQATDSPTADMIAKLPSPGSLLQTTGTVAGVGSFGGVPTSGLIDLAAASAVYYFGVR